MDDSKRLDQFVRTIEEHFAPDADLQATVAHENAISTSLGGRSIFDDHRPKKTQLKLFGE